MGDMKLLIADDEVLIRKGLLSLSWDSIGITRVYSAENGIEAKKVLLDEQIDILLSDIRMPGATGLEVAELINRYSLDMAVILLTGFSEFEYAREALKSNVYDYILKPLRPSDILETVAEAKKRLERRRYQNQVVRRHEEKMGSFDTLTQIQNCFEGCNQQIRGILEYLGENYDQDITLNCLAEKYHFSATYVSRLLKKETGYAFSDILTGIRLLNAVEMLSEPPGKIGRICDKTGFRDPRYFSQVFKKVFSCTPGEYKKHPKRLKLKEILEIMQ